REYVTSPFVAWKRVSTGLRCETSARLASLELRFGADPCHVRPWWHEPPPAFTTTGTISNSAPSGAAARAPASQSSGAWNCARSGADFGQRVGPRSYSG